LWSFRRTGASESPHSSQDWTSFPTIFFVKAGGNATVYDGERTAKGLWSFVCIVILGLRQTLFEGDEERKRKKEGETESQKDRERERDRQTDRQTDRRTDRQTDR